MSPKPVTEVRALLADVAAEWEDRPHRLPDVIEQVEAIASKLKEWGWGGRHWPR